MLFKERVKSAFRAELAPRSLEKIKRIRETLLKPPVDEVEYALAQEEKAYTFAALRQFKFEDVFARFEQFKPKRERAHRLLLRASVFT